MDPVMVEIGNQQIREVLQASQAVSNHTKNDHGVANWVTFRFCDRNVPGTPINGSGFIHFN